MSLRLPAAALIAAIAFPGSLTASAPAAAAEPLATCFWEGPVSMKRPSSRGFDGHFFNYPEESATYWLARFQLPQGAKIRLTGRYAYARYQSLNAYSDGAPTDALSDLATGPDPGSVNPFIAGNRRNLAQRSYTVTVVNEPPPSGAGRRTPSTRSLNPAPPSSCSTGSTSPTVAGTWTAARASPRRSSYGPMEAPPRTRTRARR